MDRKDRIARHYEHRIDTGRENFDVLDWASAESQNARFEVLVVNVDLQDKSLLDVGCGLGDLSTFLKDRKINVHYTGLDIIEKMLTAAAAKHPNAKFICGDMFAEDASPLPEGNIFDVVFCSGTFNLNLGNNADFLPQAVGRLMAIASERVVFNLLNKSVLFESETYACYDPGQVLGWLARTGWDIRMIDGYLPNDFTLICTRQ